MKIINSENYDPILFVGKNKHTNQIEMFMDGKDIDLLEVLIQLVEKDKDLFKLMKIAVIKKSQTDISKSKNGKKFHK